MAKGFGADFKKSQKGNAGTARGTSHQMGREAIPKTVNTVSDDLYILIEPGKLSDNPFQPRKEYNEKLIEELSQSIVENGLLQPVVARPHPEDPGSFQIAYGHRRYRACIKAQLPTIKVIVRQMNDVEMSITSIVENLQRDELSILDSAYAYKGLLDSGISLDNIAKKVSISKSVISRTIRFLELPEAILEEMAGEQFSISKSIMMELVALETSEVLEIWPTLLSNHVTIREFRELVQKMHDKQSESINDRESDEEQEPTPTAQKLYSFIKYTSTNRSQSIKFSQTDLKRNPKALIEELELLVADLKSDIDFN
jgi:ParB family transcriptional regulator, chromosome partitioning protein